MILFRSLCKELYSCLLAIILVLLIIFITNQFVQLVKSVAHGQLTMLAVLKVISLQVPLLLGYLLPLSFYLAIMLVLGRFYLDHEMAVLSACGVSKAKLLGMVMVFGLMLSIIVTWLILWVEPVIQSYRITVVEKAAAVASIDKIQPRSFKRLPKGGVFYVGDLSHRKDQLYNAFLAFHKQPTHAGQSAYWDITVAKMAQHSERYQHVGQFLEFDQGGRYLGIPGHNDFKEMHFKRYGIKLALHLASTRDWPMNVPTLQLWQLAKTNLKAAAMLQWRIAMPVSVFLLALIAFPLSCVNPRLGRFTQLLPAILIYTVYADLLFLGRAWIEHGVVSPALGLWWLQGAMLLLGIILNLHFFGWRRIVGMLGRREVHYAST